MPSIEDVKLIKFDSFSDKNGFLVPVEQNEEVPFPIRRLFWIFGNKNKNLRGEHAHYKTEQVLIPLKGACKAVCNDGINERVFVLDSPFQGLYMPAMIWGHQTYEKDSIILVLANTFYGRNDYIEEWETFKKEVKSSLGD